MGKCRCISDANETAGNGLGEVCDEGMVWGSILEKGAMSLASCGCSTTDQDRLFNNLGIELVMFVHGYRACDVRACEFTKVSMESNLALCKRS